MGAARRHRGGRGAWPRLKGPARPRALRTWARSREGRGGAGPGRPLGGPSPPPPSRLISIDFPFSFYFPFGARLRYSIYLLSSFDVLPLRYCQCRLRFSTIFPEFTKFFIANIVFSLPLPSALFAVFNVLPIFHILPIVNIFPILNTYSHATYFSYFKFLTFSIFLIFNIPHIQLIPHI